MTTHPQDEGTRPRSEFAATLARVLKHVWPLFNAADDGIATELDLFRPLPAVERIVALVVRGPAASHGIEATRDHALLRLETLGAGAETLAPIAAVALGRPGDTSYDELNRLAKEALHASPRERRVAAAALALGPALPLSIGTAHVFVGIEDPDVSGCLGLAVGRAARRGDIRAARLVCEILRQGRELTSQSLAIGLLKGLGDGLFDTGLVRLTATMRGSLSSNGKHWLALNNAVVLCAHDCKLPLSFVDSLGAALIRHIPDGNAHFIDTHLSRHPPDALTRWFDVKAASWPSLPGTARSAVVHHFAAAGALPANIARHLGAERHPAVIHDLLELEIATASGSAAAPASLDLQAYVHCWSNIRDVSIRTLLARRMVRHARAEVPEIIGGAEIVTLPPRALARDDLDRLRLAIWENESERLVELASRVPLDRRHEARSALVGCLDVPDAALRRAAIEAIGRIGGIADANALLDVARRHRALEGTVAAALRSLNARAAADPLAHIFRRRLKWADDEAVDDWWALGGDDNVAHLLSGLEVRYYPLARAGAARALGRHRAQEVVFALRMAALSDPHEGARLAALQALSELAGNTPSSGETVGYGLLVRSGEDLPDAIERAREVGTAALPGLRRALVKGSWRRRRAACQALSGIDGEGAATMLVDSLSDIDEDVRLAAAEALMQRGWFPHTPREHTLLALASRSLERLADKPDDADRTTLFDALELGGHLFRMEVLACLHLLDFVGLEMMSPRERLQFHAARHEFALILSLEGGLDAILLVIDNTWQSEPHRAAMVSRLHDLPAERLLSAIEAPHLSWRSRQALAESLSFRTDDAAVSLLRIFVADEEDDVRRAALQSLVYCAAARLEAGLDTAPISSAFELALTSPFPDDRDQAAAAIGAVGPGVADWVKVMIADPWWEVRHAAAVALGTWSAAVDLAADLLLRLAVDSEFKVGEAARASLEKLGRLPSVPARCAAVEIATPLAMHGLEPWFGVVDDAGAPPDLAYAVDHLIDTCPDDSLPQRIGLIGILRVQHLAGWLEDAALGRTSQHIGIRLAASAALRGLVRQECQTCGDAKTLPCPACSEQGEFACPDCRGTGHALADCPEPDCSASQATRRIDSPRCPTCHGRRMVPTVCDCQAGPRPGKRLCGLCLGHKRIPCVTCSSNGSRN